jgi:adenylate kinase family enzyme
MEGIPPKKSPRISQNQTRRFEDSIVSHLLLLGVSQDWATSNQWLFLGFPQTLPTF